MTFLESYEYLKESSDLFDTRMAKVQSYMNAAVNEHAINLEECELKVMKESGTIDDLAYLVEEAKDGFIGRIKNAIAAIIKAFKEFCASIKTKILSAISNTEEGIRNIQKKVKMNPILARKKVQYNDTEKEMKLCDKYLDKIKKFITKAKHSDVDKKEVSDMRDEYEVDRRRVIGGALVVISLSAAIGLLLSRKDKTGKMCNEAEKESSSVIESAMSGLDENTKESCAEAAEAAASFASKVAKDKQNAIVDHFGNLMTSVKNTVSKMKGNTSLTPDEEDIRGTKRFGSKPKSTKESVEDSDLAYLESLHEDLFGESDDDDDSYENEYMESLENDIFGDLESVGESADDSFLDDDTDTDISNILDNYLSEDF